MRVALISDIHANEMALLAVLDDIEKRSVDRIVCLGDVATLGPRPHAVLGILRELGCTCILGNHDEFLLDATCVAGYSRQSVIVESVEWCRRDLTRQEHDFLAGFEHTAEIALDEGSRLLLFHGSPNSNTTDILSTTSPERLDEVLAGERAAVMAGGHTHLQMLRQHHGSLLVNPGSVGMPFRDYREGHPPQLMAHAEYATVEARDGRIDVGLHRVALEAR